MSEMANGKFRRFGCKPYGGGVFIVLDQERNAVLREADYGPQKGVLFAGNEAGTLFRNRRDAMLAIERSQEWAAKNSATSWKQSDYEIVELYQHIGKKRRNTPAKLQRSVKCAV